MIDKDTGEIVLPMLRTPYNYDADAVSRETGLACADPTRAQQQFKEDSDINTIVKRFGLTGQLPDNVRVPVEGDFSNVTDYQSAMNVVRRAQESFMEMPADVRERFGNDPGKFVAFVNDKNNLDEARKLGIAVAAPVPAPAPEPMLVRVVPDPAPK